MTLSLHHNDVITVKILNFTKILPIKEEKFIDVSEFKKNDKLMVQNKKKTSFFNINNRILKKLSVTKRVFSAKIQCTNVTLARKLQHYYFTQIPCI